MDYRAGAKEWVERTCGEQGLPAKIVDIATILRVAAIFVEASDAPNRVKPVEINVLGRTFRGADVNVVEDGSDDGAFLMEAQVGPTSPQLCALVDEVAE